MMMSHLLTLHLGSFVKSGRVWLCMYGMCCAGTRPGCLSSCEELTVTGSGCVVQVGSRELLRALQAGREALGSKQEQRGGLANMLGWGATSPFEQVW